MDAHETEGGVTGFEFRSVSRDYGAHSDLSDISFSVRPREHTAILGTSGCGKSTILRLLAGLDTPTSGTVLFDGRSASEMNRINIPPHRRGISMLFQDLALWPNLSVLDNVLMGLSGLNLSKKDAGSRARQVLELCSIDRLANKKPERISGGEQQRAALARALAPEPDYLLLDEPFSCLDLVTKSTLLEDIRQLASEREITIVLVSHDPMEATTLCQGAIAVDDGRIVELGEWSDLLRKPRSKVLELFRDHLNRSG